MAPGGRMAMTPPAWPSRLTRRAALFVPFVASGCAAPPPPEPFRFVDGIGSRAGGPFPSRYVAPEGGFPRGDRGNWWQTRVSVDSLSRLDEIFPAARCAAPGAAAPRRRRPAEPVIRYAGAPALGAGDFDLDGYMARNPATGLLLIRDGEILAERYQYARHDRQRLTSFSMAKTITALLIGIAIQDGLLPGIDRTVESIVPELAGTEYGATPLRALLTMSSGVAFREDYVGLDDSARLTLLTIGGQSPGGVAVPPHFNRRIAAPGARWSYSSGETFVLALVLRRAIGRPVAAYLSEKLWRPMGAEADASWLVDGAGQELGYMGFNAVLRDYGRLGMLLATGGRAGARQLVPPAWLAEMTRAHFTGTQTGRWFGYGLQTWVFPGGDGDFALLGLRGQAIFVDPGRKLVLVHTAVREATGDAGGADLVALWRGVKRGV